MAQTVTFTTYKQDGVSISGTPFVLGFKDKTSDAFDNTGESEEADLELPPPPPPGGTTGAPISTSYIDTMYIHLDNDVKGYQYFLSNDTIDDVSLNLAVRDYEDDNVIFKYNQDSVTNMFGKLEITNNSWTIDLVTSTVTGASNDLPSISTADSVTTVELPHLGDGLYYRMNVKQPDSGVTEDTVTVNSAGWYMFSVPAQAIVSTSGSVSDSMWWYGGSDLKYLEYKLSNSPLLEPKRGYWVKTLEASVTLTITYETPFTNPVGTDTVTVSSAGWYMFSVPAQAIVTTSGSVSDSMWWYGGSDLKYLEYKLSNSPLLEPKRGYWIKTLEAGVTLTITYQ